MRESMKGEKNPRWVGDKVKYESIHGYVRRYKKKPKKCKMCDKKTSSLDLAYKDMDSGKNNLNYSRNLDKWFYICRSCHMKADGRMNNLKQYRIKKFTPKDGFWDAVKKQQDKQTDKLYNTEYISKGCGKGIVYKGREIYCGNYIYNEYGKKEQGLCTKCQSKSNQSQISNQSSQSGLESVKKIESASEDKVSEQIPRGKQNSDTFCLKDKIEHSDYDGLEIPDGKIKVKDFKEFIKVLKEDTQGQINLTWQEFHQMIDKRAGDL